MVKDIVVPVWEKYILTAKEASQYFGIGINKLYKFIEDNEGADWILVKGTQKLIKRKKFEALLDIMEEI